MAARTGVCHDCPMTPTAFRKLALSLPDAEEKAHGGHPDFRVEGKIFASMGSPDAGSATVKLTPEEQAVMMDAEPGTFSPSAGAWGRGGWTQVNLAALDATTAKSALTAAWRNVAPRTLVTNRAGGKKPKSRTTP